MLKLHQVDSDCDDSGDDSEDGPGGLLRELEQRQDDVLAQLEALNQQVEAVLRGLGVRLDEPSPAELNFAASED